MSDRQDFWFPAKRYGWGWGFPVRWQGWLVMAAYFAAVLAGIYYFNPDRRPIAVAVCIVSATVVFIVVVAIKGEHPLRWRWGKR